MGASIVLLATLATTVSVAQTPVPWELPNFSDRLDIVVENPTSHALSALAILHVDEIRSLAPTFPGTLAIAANTKQPTRFLSIQVDDLDGHSEVAIAVQLAPRERQPLSIYYSTTLHETLPAVQRVHAVHSYGYNHATVAIESELIGYRTYGGFFFDVQAHRRNQRGLFNSFIGYASISNPPVEGEDIIHLGDTLGLGGLFLRAGETTYRPPVNTPDYSHRRPKPEEPTYRVLADGPLRAIVEAKLAQWTLGDETVSLRALYEMRAGEESVRCRWWITPLHLSRSYGVGAGIRDLPEMKTVEANGIIVNSGTQEAKVGPLALGLAFSTSEAHRAGSMATPEGGNEIIAFTHKLTPQAGASGTYAFAAAWSGSGSPDVATHLQQVLQNEAVEPKLKVVAHLTNPDPERLEGEPR